MAGRLEGTTGIPRETGQVFSRWKEQAAPPEDPGSHQKGKRDPTSCKVCGEMHDLSVAVRCVENRRICQAQVTEKVIILQTGRTRCGKCCALAVRSLLSFVSCLSGLHSILSEARARAVSCPNG